MNSLVELTIDAHGGLERWRRFEHVSAHLRNDGVLWTLKHQQGVLDDVNVRVSVRTSVLVNASWPQRLGESDSDFVACLCCWTINDDFFHYEVVDIGPRSSPVRSWTSVADGFHDCGA